MTEELVEHDAHRKKYDGTLVGLTYLVASFLSFIGAIIIYLLKKDDCNPSTEQGLKDVLNFTISYAIYALISIVLMFVLIGFILAPLIFLAYYIFLVIAIVKNAKGEYYTPPLTISFF